MCDVCCREFRGWCKSFTKTETVLSLLEFLLLILFFVFLVFLILHFISCQSPSKEIVSSTIKNTEDINDTSDVLESTASESTPKLTSHVTQTRTRSTSPSIACTWKISKKTPALTHYSEIVNKTESYLPDENTDLHTSTETSPTEPLYTSQVEDSGSWDIGEELNPEADDIYNSFVMALVKMNPPKDLTFGCILTVVSKRWVLTAASCVEAIEEVDSLDSFVMLENYGEPRYGKTYAVSNIQVHPDYQGTDRSFDIVALKSDDSFLEVKKVIQLPDMIDYFLITIGESFTLLGFGKFRS